VGGLWEEQRVSVDDLPPDAPDVIPCEIDPAYECVRIGSQTASGQLATPPPSGEPDRERRLCPEGYVPRRRRRQYQLAGKRIVNAGGEPAKRNPGGDE
jgi:hypothetical protein